MPNETTEPQIHQNIIHGETASLGDAFKNEVAFTGWLSKNLQYLERALQIPNITLVSAEAAVGDFRADIVATAQDEPMAIEAKLGDSDHKHLGQLITYVAGINAGSAVYIAECMRPEHRAALDFLNRNSNVSFYGLEPMVMRIDDRFMVHFTVVSQPHAKTPGDSFTIFRNLHIERHVAAYTPQEWRDAATRQGCHAGTAYAQRTPARREFLNALESAYDVPISAFYANVLAAPLNNIVNSWGAQNESGVFLSVWEDEFMRHEGADYIWVDNLGHESSPGANERTNHVNAIREGKDAYLITRGRDENGRPGRYDRVIRRGGRLLEREGRVYIEVLRGGLLPNELVHKT